MSIMENYDRPILRQCRESISIARALVDRDKGTNIEVMNSKKEFIQPGTIRPRFGRLLHLGTAA